ncbi:hypothetical protein BVC80_7463g3 [Macleaya cordata]|uniref:Uncharacterized protein n=1 Tax=Macleaya cordata TaxID=56857 RepID=A0A200PMK5_MACCD|nr:hypothetical protein BVC80_7463g3 [Macleaya cordata]
MDSMSNASNDGYYLFTPPVQLAGPIVRILHRKQLKIQPISMTVMSTSNLVWRNYQ